MLGTPGGAGASARRIRQTPATSLGLVETPADSLLAPQKACLEACLWGRKEPNTHVVIDRLMRLMPKMKYLHVARNGLDMAYSANQNQLKFWGGHFIGPECEMSPYYSLKYWRLIHRRVLDLCIPMGKRFFFSQLRSLLLESLGGVARAARFP